MSFYIYIKHNKHNNPFQILIFCFENLLTQYTVLITFADPFVDTVSAAFII